MRTLISVVLVAFLAAALPTYAQQDAARVPAIPETEKQPGYGVVESVREVRVLPERSAAAGGSAPGAAQDERPAYRVTVRMADGSIQQRDLHKPEFKKGDPVLLTNAGEIVRD
jgi:hypothetical protein